ncbi:MAG TPA: AAA family ATPase [Candidatus Saccharimonadales bacterium]
MSQLVLHPLTREQLDQFGTQPPHAILLVGAAGSGKSALATQLAETILELPPYDFDQYAYSTRIEPSDGKAIGIEAIRELEHFLSLKVPTRTAQNRLVIIENAHTLTTEAQNALLKTLEEPPKGTVLLLTATSEQALLPTIRSRVQKIAVKRPLTDDIIQHFTARGHDQKAIKQAYGISGGLPGLMTALLEDSDHPLREATEIARKLLGQNTYERLLMVDQLSKQKTEAQDVLFILQQMAHVSLQTASGKVADRWKAVLQASYQASEQLANSAQPKLALTNFVLYL